MECPVCTLNFERFYGHLIKMENNDNEHKKLLEQQLILIKKLFYDINFNKNSNIKDYNLKIDYNHCLNIWLKEYGKDECKKRSNKLNGKSVSKAMKGKKLSEEHKHKLSEAHMGQIPWNKKEK